MLLRFLVFLAACLCSGMVVGELASQKYEQKFVYPGSLVAERLSSSDSAGHSLILSPVERINNEMYIENQKFLNARRFDWLLELPPRTSHENVMRFYRDIATNYGDVLYECRKRECGINNYWANALFGQSKLKGRDSDQAYLAAKLKFDDNTYYLSVYIVNNYLRKEKVFVRLLSVGEFVSQGLENSLSLKLDSKEDEKRITSLIVKGKEDLNDKMLSELKKITTGKNIALVAYTNSHNVTKNAAFEGVQNDVENMAALLKNKLNYSGDPKVIVVGPFHSEENHHQNKAWFRLFVY